MRQTILAALVLLATGMMAGPACAADTVKVDLTALLQAAYQAMAADPASSDPGRKADGIFSNTQLYVVGSTGLEDPALPAGRDEPSPYSTERWVAAVGAGYTIDLLTLGVEYSHLDRDESAIAGELQQDRFSLIGNYALSPGVNLESEFGYSRIDTGPDRNPSSGSDVDHAFEIGIGTNFTF